MSKSKARRLQVVGNRFESCVIIVCIVLIITSFLQYRQPGLDRNRKYNFNVLKNERESFRFAMHHSYQNTTVKEIKYMEKTLPTTNIYKDEFRTWFTDKNIAKYHVRRSHPVLKPEVINNNICNDSPVDILIYVQSHWDHFQRRTILRETWAGTNIFKDIIIKSIFILGRPGKGKRKGQIKINNESIAHRDIIQGNFDDTLGNVTMKSILALQLINDHCIQAKYILKADDDIFVNIYAVVQYLIPQIYDKKKVVMCHVNENSTIVRDKARTWHVPNTVWKGLTHYPKFCRGYFALFTSDLIPSLYKASFSAPYLSVDDVYLFGLLMEKIPDVEYIDLQDFMTMDQNKTLSEYTGNGPLLHVATRASGTGYLEKLWLATMSKLTNWAKNHTKLEVVKKQIHDIIKKYHI